MKGEYEVKEPLLAKYIQMTKRLLAGYNYDLKGYQDKRIVE